MCTGANSGNFQQGPFGPSYNILNPRRTLDQYEIYMRKDFGPGGKADAGRALQRSFDETAAKQAADMPPEDLTAPPDNRGTAVQRRKPRSLLSLAGGGGDPSSANVGGGMAKAVLGA